MPNVKPRRVTPTATLLLPADAPRERWLATRRGGVGSSDVAAILGLSKRQTAQHVWYDKQGRLPEQDTDEAAMWGNILEDPVAREWARRNKAVINRVGLVAHVDSPWELCTLDRKVTGCPLGGPACMLEVKTRSAWVAGRWGAGIPDDVHAQVVWAMHVTGYDHAHVAVLIGGQDFRQYVVARDATLELDLLRIVRPFWQHCVVGGHIPAVSPDDDPERIGELYARLHPDRKGSSALSEPLRTYEALLEYDGHRLAESAEKRTRKALRNQLVAELGGAEVATVDGEPVYGVRPGMSRQVDWDRMRLQYPEAYDDCVTENPTQSFWVGDYRRLENHR